MIQRQPIQRLHQACIAAAVVAATSWTVPGHADTVRLTSGDELNGQVDAVLDNGDVIFIHPDLGRITIDSDRVSGVERGTEGVDAASGPSKAPKSKPKPKPNPDPAVEADTARMANHTPAPRRSRPVGPALDRPGERGGLFNTGLLASWDSSLTFAFNGSENDISRQSVLARFRTVKSNDDDRWVFDAKYFFASTGGETTQNELRSEVVKDWLIPDSPWFIFASAAWDHDSFKQWRDRVSLFGGMGYELADTDQLEWVVRGGVGGSYEFGQVSDFTPEAMFGTSVIKWNLSDRQSINANATLFPNLEYGGEFRLTTGVEWKLKIDEMDGVSLKLGMQNDYESITRGNDSNNDLKYYAGVTFDF